MRKTEKEIIQAARQNTFSIDKAIKNNKYSLSEIGELIPGMLHINDNRSLEIRYMSEFLEADLTDANKHLFSCIHPFTAQFSFTQLNNLIAQDDATEICSVPLLIKKTPKTQQYEWYFANSKIYKHDSLLAISIPFSKLERSITQLNKLFDDHLFIRKQFERFCSLTKREKEILKLIASGHTNYQIAERLFISRDTVRTHRNRLYKKLDIKHLADTIRYAQAFDL